MNHLNATMFVCFSFCNFHLHPGGFVNKMTKIYFFTFRRKNSIFTVLAENIFTVFEKIGGFREKVHFYGFGGKIRFMGFAEK